MSYFMLDVETDGPIPGPYSMVSLGAVVVRPGLSDTFYGEFKPISEKWDPIALAVSGVSREKHLGFEDPIVVMQRFADWIKSTSVDRPIFIADNNGFDWQFVNWYFHSFYGSNPFGFSSRNLNDIYKGMKNDMMVNFKHLRMTKHTHNPVDDAMGNAEALLSMRDMGLKIPLR